MFISEWETPTWPRSIQMGVTAGIFLASILLKEMRYLVYIRYLWGHPVLLPLLLSPERIVICIVAPPPERILFAYLQVIQFIFNRVRLI